jgi:hypothetical protein
MAGSLAIDRFQIAGIAPCDHPDPGRLKHALGLLDQRRLIHAISSALGDFGTNDQRFIIVNRLELAMTETGIGDADLLSRRLAEGVRNALARLADMSPNDAVVAFPSRAVRIAAFVTAAAKGEAWGKWWFSDLDHLKVLPTSSAIRVVLAREPLEGLEALAALTNSDRARLLESLSAIDAKDLLNDFAAALPEGASEEAWPRVFALPYALPNWSPVKAALHYLGLLARDASPSRTALIAIRARVEFATIRDVRALAGAIRTGSVRALATAAPGLRPSVIAAVASLKETTRVRMAAELRRPARNEAMPTFTRFGGVLLLWPHLPAIDTRLPSHRSGQPAALIGLIGIASLFGAAAAEALEDSVLREIVGIELRTTIEDLADWLSQIHANWLPAPRNKLQDSALPLPFSRCHEQSLRVREYAQQALEDFARRLPGLAAASLPFLRTNLLQIGAHVVASKEGVRSVLDRPPLDVLLGITGLADRSAALPDGRILMLERAK